MSIKGLGKLFLKEKLPKAVKQQFMDEITEINILRTKTVGRFMIALFILLLLLDYHNFKSGLWSQGFAYQLMAITHLSGLIFMCAFKLYVFVKNRSKSEFTTYKKHILLFITGNLFLAHMAVISYCDVLINGSAAAYIGAIFALAAFSMLLPMDAGVIFIVNLLLMVALLILASQQTGELFTIQIINIAIYSVFSIILSRMVFRYQKKDFLNRQKIQVQNEALEKLAMQDPLTDVMNRRHFLTVIEQEVVRSKRYGSLFSVAIFDIDFFKDINDKYGHIIGDKVLKNLCTLIHTHIRSNDVFARWGGEEFILLSLGVDKQNMLNVCEKLRLMIANNCQQGVPNITASFGISEYVEGDATEELIHRADIALYQAKASGRNCIFIK